jgi:hypothetical protein
MLNSIPSLLFENGGQVGIFVKYPGNQALNIGFAAGSWRAVAGKSPICPTRFLRARPIPTSTSALNYHLNRLFVHEVKRQS